LTIEFHIVGGVVWKEGVQHPSRGQEGRRRGVA
jgi:hypothetical protein